MGAIYVIDEVGQWPDTFDLASANPPPRLEGTESNANAGFHLAAGDFDLDGKDDIVIGVPNARASIGRDESGKVYIVFGRTSFAPITDLAALQSGTTTFFGGFAQDHLGSAVAAGRTRPGSYWDLLIGCQLLDDGLELDTGAVFLFLGSDDITPTSLLGYEAELRDDGIRLTWRLADPVDAALMRIDRRSDTDQLASFGGSAIRQADTEYEFIDRSVVPGVRYYYEAAIEGDDPQLLFTISLVTPAVARARLEASFPNPFTIETTILFRLPEAGSAELSIFDVSGALVRTLAAGPFPAGLSRVRWDGTGSDGTPLPSGIYFARLRQRQAVSHHKILLIR
jgi:hypothetical protein